MKGSLKLAAIQAKCKKISSIYLQPLQLKNRNYLAVDLSKFSSENPRNRSNMAKGKHVQNN
jgi:hypothetical protein